MDDLAGLNWSAKGGQPQPVNRPVYTSSAFSTLKPTPPASGRASPFNPSSQPPSKPATPANANDSFSNLVSFSTSVSNKNLSLQEQQKRLAELKTQQQNRPLSAQDRHYASGDDQFWNNLGSGRSTPALSTTDLTKGKSQNGTLKSPKAEDDDIFAVFNASQEKPQPSAQPKPQVGSSRPAINGDDDDDPFGLSEFEARNQAKKASQVAARTSVESTADDDDDVLGLLGEPVSRKSKVPPRAASPPQQDVSVHPQQKALTELVDMGFPPDKARAALEQTETGIDVQAAVGWLLNQAHAEARQKAQARDSSRNGTGPERSATTQRSGDTEQYQPSRPRRHVEEEEYYNEPMPGRRGEGQRTNAEKDPTQIAAELGTAFLKTAGSFWKQSTKRVQQAVQDFSSEGDSGGQPKWMKEASRQPEPEQQQPNWARNAPKQPQSEQRQPKWSAQSTSYERELADMKARLASEATDEAMMLESRGPPQRQPPQMSRPVRNMRPNSDFDSARERSPAMPSRLRESSTPEPRPGNPVQSVPSSMSSRTTLNRQALEDQAAQAYVSSARRRKPAVPAPAPDIQSDLLEGATSFNGQAQTRKPLGQQEPPPPKKPITLSSPTSTKPPPPSRTIPSISALSLKASHSYREKGNESFKRGDYAVAHQSYTTSLSHLPPTHPLSIVLLTNHALTALKIGEPKTAVSDADKVVQIIGVTKGEAETIDFANGEPPKPMREYYGKALMRKAEALEHMEKWVEAATVWRMAVEGGHGGATSIQGRARCEKAANPQASKPKPKPAQVRQTATARSGGRAAISGNSEAVQRLRMANAAAEKADDEKFALSDSVQARITAWKGGKADNLRALLASLDVVLWPEANWKKISMADLVLPGKVKIQYMKGIAKVHPDKIPTSATTEQRMIAGAVFSALNEAWDKFKTENGL